MLVLTRKPGEKVVIGRDIIVKLVEVKGERVRIAIEAPDDVRILRGELACWQEEPANDTNRASQVNRLDHVNADLVVAG